MGLGALPGVSLDIGRGGRPAKLVRGLAASVRARAVEIYERTPATMIAPHTVLTERGTVTADVVVRATDAYTSQLPGLKRALVPVY